MMNRVSEMSSTRATAAALLCCASALVAGCSSNQFLSPDTTPVAGPSIRGTIYGGNQPIIGATVQLWAVGTTGYGSAPTPLGSSVTTLAPGGSFTIGAYTCPTATTQVYLTAKGGNPGISAANPNIMMAAALGNCSAASGLFVDMNEVTTVATAFALGQYFTAAVGGPSSGDSFGAPNTTQAQAAIANAMQTVNNLANIATGNAVTTATLTGAGGSVTVTPESTKLYTIADILAACVNSLGVSDPDTFCSQLFADVKTTSGTAPTDTLQAAVYMSLNPTSNNASGSTTNLTGLFNLASANAPFVGVSTQPTDWTLGIQYTNSTVLNDPQNMAADASGNIWVINHNGTTSASLTELSGGGPAATQVAPGTPQVNVTTIGGQSISAIQPRNEAIDLNGNVWLDTTSSARMLEYNGGTGVSFSPSGFGSPYGIAIDGNNNVFYTAESSSATFQVMEFLNGTLASTAQVEYGLDSPQQQGEYAAIDTAGNLWVTNGSSTSGLETNIFQMSGYNGATAGVCTVFPCAAATTGDTTLTQTYTNINSATGGVPTLSEPFAIAAGPGGIVWTGNVTGNTITAMTSTTAGTDYGSGGTGVGASLNKPTYIAVDGVGNVWTTNNTSSPGSVSEFTGTGAGIGTVLSPVITSTSGFTTIGFSHAAIASAEGIAIDPSGNVWVASQVASTGGVFEIVGAAAPTVTPIPLALKNGTVGQKP